MTCRSATCCPIGLLTMLFGLVLAVDASSVPNPAADGTLQAKAVLRQIPTPTQPLVVELQFDLPPGFHVYVAPSHFFQLREEDTAGLGPSSVELPPTVQIHDLLADDPTATTPVMIDRATVRVTKPFLSPAPAAWRFKGALHYQGCTETTCFPPARLVFDFGTAAATPANGSPANPVRHGAPAPAPDPRRAIWGGGSVLWGMVLAFLAGVALSFTPCVYPMIGVTIAVIGGQQAGHRRALWLTACYVLGLSLMYAVCGLLIAWLGSAAASALRSAWVLILVGGVFLLMGLSMFDLFSISTPGALVERMQRMAGQGTGTGVLIMGAVSALVVGPCVSGPLLSLVTFVAASGRPLSGFLLLFAFGLGIGSILFVAGAVSGLMPKAGLWMQRVKYALGVVMVWAAFYFTRPITGETIFCMASIVCAAFGAGCLGWLSVPSPGSRHPGRQWIPVCCGVVLMGVVAYHFLAAKEIAGSADTRVRPDAVVQIRQARQQNLPTLLEFWAPWCAICRQIQREVFGKPAVQDRLRSVVVVKINYDTNADLVREFGVIGPPAFIFLDATGRQVGTVAVTARELEERILRGW